MYEDYYEEDIVCMYKCNNNNIYIYVYSIIRIKLLPPRHSISLVSFVSFYYRDIDRNIYYLILLIIE